MANSLLSSGIERTNTRFWPWMISQIPACFNYCLGFFYSTAASCFWNGSDFSLLGCMETRSFCRTRYTGMIGLSATGFMISHYDCARLDLFNCSKLS